MREELDRISPTFCAAKWLQVSLHLHNGGSHSCHHPESRRVPLKEIVADPAALHNSSAQLAQRKEMLAGLKPKDCAYCWQAEDAGAISDRFIKSGDAWARPFLKEAAARGTRATPRYLEVGFSNVCNLSCSYCSPQYSSAWLTEQERHGEIPVENRSTSLAYLAREGKLPLPAEFPNPYLEAFWQWWPSIRAGLRVLRLTGGEPLLHDETFELLADLRRNPAPELELIVNSNLMAPKERQRKFLHELESAAPSVGKVSIYTSVDSWGARAEYIRHGLRHEYFWNSVENALETFPRLEFVFMCTFNALSVTGFAPLLERVRELQLRYPGVRLDVAHLMEPAHQSVKILTADFLPRVRELARHMRELGYSEYECEKMRRVQLWMAAPLDGDRVARLRADFVRFFREHDRRRGTSLLEVFPELREFWNFCAGLKDEEIACFP
jgi:organic radical activating enzyme